MVTMPVDKGFYVTSGFGPRWGTHHWGTDFGCDGGSGGKPIYAVKDGTIARVGPATGFGQWIGVDHPASNGGGETIYGHIIPEVSLGQQVREGQRIGRIDPNRATNGGVDPHLHLEWHRYSWVPPGPDRLDPMVMLKGARWPGEVKAPVSESTEVKKVADNAVDIDKHHLITFGRPTPLPKKRIIVHTTENTPGTSSQAILDYQVRSRTGSYHRLVDATGKITLANTDDWQTWSVGNKGNDIALHVSLVAQAKMTRPEWLAQPKMLEGCARVVAYWARTYDIPLVKLTREELGAGKHGVAGHLEAQVWGNTDHWDPGYHFPYDVVLARAKEINAGKSAPAVAIPPSPAPKAPLTLDTPCKSHVPGSKHVAPLADYIMYIDRGVYEGRRMIDSNAKRLEALEKKFDRLLELVEKKEQ
ncbi:peptidoglycan DD-metalloendopeptidase family protein [Corynebacterium lactis]|uniref:N-acetylmuramoyl-L-alanine amidase n=1 Tax=Corynebacterium lactis RW2-5 TaxID=1408189 RepID=A0A0K2GYR7_9CORY|nr:peptidoglycan DD-metalloendopeptidase family protein [Corynebacterium lactis]ALA66930.1 N-acetylmuramoyl-L-alanine amidase [Corynebacterium lactis RW2-5]